MNGICKNENIESNFFCFVCCFQIPIIKVDSNQKLGEWAGLCKLDAEGKARKVVRCSSVVVRDWGKESPAHDIIKDYIKSQH
jgi:small subunit ribosomal protein S12e